MNCGFMRSRKFQTPCPNVSAEKVVRGLNQNKSGIIIRLEAGTSK